MVVRQENNVNYIDWVSDYTSTATQEIVFGENLLDLTDESTAEDIFTVLIPLGDNNLTVATVNQGSDELVDQTKVAKYGRIIKTNVFSNVTSAQTLLENGRRYLANNGDAPTTLTLTAIDLHNVYPEVNAIELGDRVYIRSEPHELSQYLTCTKIEYDLEKPENTVYTFGREKQSLTQRYREDQRAQNDTYGNTAGGGGGGIGATAGEEAGNWHFLEDNVLEETDDKISDSEDDIKQKIIYKIGVDLDHEGNTVNIYSIATKTDTNESAVARIVTWAGEDDQGNLGSRIALEADLVSVSNRLQAVEGIFSNITAETAYASKGISSHTFYGSNYYISSSGDTEVNLATHAHNIIDNGSGLVLTGPIPLSSRVPFNIADTQAYQEGVSAVVLTSLVGTSYTAEDSILSGTVPLKADTIYSGNMVFGCLTTTLSNGNTRTIRVGICSDKAYEDGKTDGYSDVILNALAGTTYTSEDSILSGTVTSKSNTVYSGNMIFGCLTTTLSPTGRVRTIRVGLNAELAYEAGQASVPLRTVNSVSYVVNGGVTDYSHINVLLSDGTVQRNVSITNAWQSGYNSGYNAGYTAGRGSVSVNYSGGSYDINIVGRHYNPDYEVDAVKINVILTNGKSVNSGYLYF